MSYTEKLIVQSYLSLFEGLTSSGKNELIDLSMSLKKDKTIQDDMFYASFGAFSDDKTAEDIIEDIKSVRRFSNKEIIL